MLSKKIGGSQGARRQGPAMRRGKTDAPGHDKMTPCFSRMRHLMRHISDSPG